MVEPGSRHGWITKNGDVEEWIKVNILKSDIIEIGLYRAKVLNNILFNNDMGLNKKPVFCI
jgi:hypothetical protein